jgi:glycosyltransferase involved in cell wall biosynthesis
LHVCSERGLRAKMEVVTETRGTLMTHYVYTSKITIGIPFLSQWLKRRRMLKAYELGFENIKQKQGPPHLIHLNVVLPAGIGVLQLHKKYKIPFVVNEGWTGYMKEDGNYRGFFVKYFTQKVIKAASFILPVSKDLQAAMQSHGLKGKYKIVPNVIQTEIFKPLATSSLALGAGEGSTFVHVSTFDPRQKNVLGILHALKVAIEKRPNLNLCLVGESEHKSELMAFVKANHLEKNVQFKGKLNAEALAYLFNQCKALIMFSNYESFGVVLGEALSCGLPVICSKTGGLSSELTIQQGVVMQKNNEEQLTMAMLDMADDKVVYDKKALRNFVIERYSETVIAEELKKVYHQALTDNK